MRITNNSIKYNMSKCNGKLYNELNNCKYMMYKDE